VPSPCSRMGRALTTKQFRKQHHGGRGFIATRKAEDMTSDMGVSAPGYFSSRVSAAGGRTSSFAYCRAGSLPGGDVNETLRHYFSE